MTNNDIDTTAPAGRGEGVGLPKEVMDVFREQVNKFPIKVDLEQSKVNQPDTKVKGWEEGFEEWWTDVYFRLETFEPSKPMLPPGETAHEVKSYIRSLLSSQAQEIRRECIEVVIGMKKIVYGDGLYVKCDDIIKVLEANE